MSADAETDGWLVGCTGRWHLKEAFRDGRGVFKWWVCDECGHVDDAHHTFDGKGCGTIDGYYGKTALRCHCRRKPPQRITRPFAIPAPTP